MMVNNETHNNNVSGAIGAMQHNSNASSVAADVHGGNRVATIFRRSSHPVALLFHTLFRTLAILVYLFGYSITQNFVLVFVVTVLLLAFDFWTVKNISGRLLVGLRWWNQVNDDGSTQWVFESRENNQPNPGDSGVFWTTLYAYTIIWCVFAVLQIFHPSWLCITIVALSLNGANVLGYTKCDKDAKKRFAGYGQSVFGSSVGQGIMGSLVSRSFGGFFGSSGNRQ